MRVVYWGTYDMGKPRNRIMIRGLRENGVEVLECHANIWEGIEDKSQVSGWTDRIRILVRWLIAYPELLLRYLHLPKHDAVIIGYMGQLDVLVLRLFAQLRGVPLVWDAFMSLYDTVVEDRKLISSRHLLARILFAWEWLACWMADCIILDTKAHGQYFVDTFNLPPDKIERVFVGTETDVFVPSHSNQCESRTGGETQPFTVLFYGQFIPLHGLGTVVEAAKLTEGRNIRWVLIGKGQESSNIRKLIERLDSGNLRLVDWVPYEELSTWIHSADVCLGIFGDTAKAKRVIPNKVFQVFAAGKPLITGDTPAIRELLEPGEGVTLIPMENSKALATAVSNLSEKLKQASSPDPNISIVERISPVAIGGNFRSIITNLLVRRRTQSGH